MTSATAIALFAATLLSAQELGRAVKDTLKDYNDHPGVGTATQLMNALIQDAMEGNAAANTAAAANEGRRLALKLLANRQDGAPAGVGAGTSLVDLKSVSDLIAGALDSGALNKTTQGSVATFRANVVGTFRLFSGDCPSGSMLQYPACITEDTSAWRGLSVALSFDSSRQDQVTPSAPASPSASIGALLLRTKQGFSAANVRYDFYRPQNQKSQKFADDWKTGIADLRKTAGDFATALGEGPSSLVAQAIAAHKPAELDHKLAPLPPDKRLAAARNFVTEFLSEPGHQLTADKRAAFVAARDQFLKKEVQFFKDTLHRKLFTLEFTHQRPKDEPEYGSTRFISSFHGRQAP